MPLCNLTSETISRYRHSAMFPRSLCFLLLMGSFAIGTSQQPLAPYSFEWELVAVDSIPGMATVRLHAKLVNPTDYLTSVSGWDEMEGMVTTTTSFYQHPEGWATPNNNNPLLFTPLPDLRWDSWITIGIDVAPVGADGEIPVGLFPPQTSYWVDEFEAGGDLVMDVDGAWFVTSGSSNGIAGEDLRVLVGQFTTDGVINGYLNLQVFSEGVASDDFMDDVYSIPIPEFDATQLSDLSEQQVVQWQIRRLPDGRLAHGVSHEVASWSLLDFTGRVKEGGSARQGRFRSGGGGLCILRNAAGEVVSRKLLP